MNLIEQFYTVIRYVRRFGIKCGMITLIKITRTKKTDSLKIRGFREPIKLRSKGSSDKCAFYKIILDKEYELKLPFTPEYIIDAGANIGLVSVYFANRYPDAKIIAIEPDKKNFDVLSENIKGYPQITGLNAALWQYSSYVRIKDGAPGTMSFIVEECSESDTNAIKAFSVKKVMNQFGFERIDLVKMDIEGSEKDVLNMSHEWLAHTNALIIELHDSIQQGCSQAFFKAINLYDFRIEPKIDNLLIVKESAYYSKSCPE